MSFACCSLIAAKALVENPILPKIIAPIINIFHLNPLLIVINSIFIQILFFIFILTL